MMFRGPGRMLPLIVLMLAGCGGDTAVETPDAVTWSGQIDGESTGFIPMLARDNLVCTVRPADELPNGYWGNPGVDVWRFTPATGDE